MSSRARGIAVVVVVLSALVGLTATADAFPTSGDGAQPALTEADRRAAQTDAPDGDLQSGASAWQGQRLRFDASSVLDGSDGGRTFELWRVTDDGQLNQRIRTFTVRENGTYVLDTGGLDGRFVLRYGGEPVYVHQGRGYLRSPPDGSVVTVPTSAFRVERQTLSFDWSDPTAYPGQEVTLTVETNRASSVVAVSAGNLSFGNLTTAFPESVHASDHDARADDDVLLVELAGSTTVDLNTTPIPPGSGDFQFDVVDAVTSETAALTVQKPAPDRRFRSIERHEHVGDVVEAELACSSCFVVIGGPGQGFLDVLEIDDSNGDGNVTLRINTRYAGMATGVSGYPSGVRAYTSPDDSVARYSASADLESVQEELTYDVTTLNDLREQQGLVPAGRYSPVEPGRIRLTVTSSDFVIKRSAYGSVPPLGAELVVRDETDVETVTLAPRSLDGAQTLAAPVGGGFEVSAESLRDATGARSRVALGDRLVFRFDVSGVFGYLAKPDVNAESLADDDDEGISLSLERIDGGAAESIRLGRIAARIVPDPAGDSLYLVLRTGGSNPGRLQAGEYRATLSLHGVAEENGAYSTWQGHDGYPYLAPGDAEHASSTATLSEAEVAISEPAAGSSPHLTADGELGVAGTATVAPGTMLAVTAESTEYAWETGTTTAVRADGSWSTELALAEAPGDEFDVTVSRSGESMATATYAVRPAPANETSEGGSGGGGGGNDAGGQTSGEDVGGLPIPDQGGLTELVVPVGGSLGALVVVWGIWRLVIRRILL